MEIKWQQVVLNLRNYKSLESISTLLDMDAQHLRRLARGDVKQPRFESGLRLLDLHYEQFPELHTQENICQ